MSSLAEELKSLAELRDQGVLTEQEFEQEKARLLGGQPAAPPAASPQPPPAAPPAASLHQQNPIPPQNPALLTAEQLNATNVGNVPPMTFGRAIETCFKKYADFNGRASRAEYWWFFLFSFIVNLALSFLPVIGQIISLGLIIPGISAAARRLHDTNRSGWLQLLPGVPMVLAALLFGAGAGSGADALFVLGAIIGLGAAGLGILLLIWLASAGQPAKNQYGSMPLA